MIIRNIKDIIKAEFTNYNNDSVYLNDDKGTTYPSDSALIKSYIEEGGIIINYEMSFAELRNFKLHKVTELRKEEQYRPFTYNKKVYVNTDKAKSSLVAKNQNWDNVTTKEWISIDYEVVNFTQKDFKSIIEQLETAETALYVKEAKLAKEIEAITNYNQLELYDVEAEWNK